jgi:hypothetical protein
MSRFGNSKASAVSIRAARTDEQRMLESLQRRASLSNPRDRDALLANPDAIALPIEQIAEGCVFVAACGFRVTGTVTTQFGIALAMRERQRQRTVYIGASNHLLGPFSKSFCSLRLRQDDPVKAQQLAERPGLKRATLGLEGRLGIGNF